MAKAYWVATYRSISNRMLWPSMRSWRVRPSWRAAASFLVRGTPAKTYEAGLQQRTVVIEFDSVAAAVAAHDSAGYQAALKAWVTGRSGTFGSSKGFDAALWIAQLMYSPTHV